MAESIVSLLSIILAATLLPHLMSAGMQALINQLELKKFTSADFLVRYFFTISLTMFYLTIATIFWIDVPGMMFKSAMVSFHDSWLHSAWLTWLSMGSFLTAYYVQCLNRSKLHTGISAGLLAPIYAFYSFHYLWRVWQQK